MTMCKIGRLLSPMQKEMLDCSVTGNVDLAQSLMALDPTALLVRNSHGLSILQLAVINRHYHFAEYLVKEGVNIHTSDDHGWTALHDAALFNCKELINILVKYGCDIVRRTDKGELPIDVAYDEEMECLLCEKMVEAGQKTLAAKYWVEFGLGYLCPNEGAWFDTGKEDAGTEEALMVANVGRGFIETANYSLQEMNNVKRGSNHASNKSCINSSCVFGNSTLKINSGSLLRPTDLRLSPLPECLSETENIDAKENAIASESNLEQTTSPLPKRRAANTFMPVKSRTVGRSQSYDTLISTQVSPKRLAELDRSCSDLGMYLTPDEIAAKLNGSRPPSAREPIHLLKMRPRKPSLVDVTRRKSKELECQSLNSSRRSVSFQPEVLLQELVAEGDTVLAKEVISSGTVDLNKMSPVGLTALHQCALDGNIELAKTLVKNGADVNSVDIDGWTPLHGAAIHNHSEMVRFLLDQGADPSIKTDDGETPFKLTRRSSIRRILFRKANGKSLDPCEADEVSDGEFSSGEEEDYSHAGSDSDDDDISLSDSDPNLTGISWLPKSYTRTSTSTRSTSVSPSPSAERDSVDSVFEDNVPSLPSSSLLLKDRNMADSTSSYGSMTDQEMLNRHQRCTEDDETSSVKTTSTLCNDETDTDKELCFSEDQGFGTMYDASSDSSHRKAICSDDEGTLHDALDSDLAKDSLDYRFQEAVLNGDVEGIAKLSKFKSKINVNRINTTSGISALHHSVLEENCALVQHLIKDFQCDINLVDSDGWTPLHAASAVGDLRIAQFLLDNGAKASFLSKNCEFPVDVAQDKAMEELLKKAMLGPTVGKMFKGHF